MAAEDLNRTYLRFANQFLEPHDQPEQLALIGMRSRGVYMACLMVKMFRLPFDYAIDFGMLDVTFYRDEYRTRLKMPEVKVTETPFDLYARDIVPLDDVL